MSWCAGMQKVCYKGSCLPGLSPTSVPLPTYACPEPADPQVFVCAPAGQEAEPDGRRKGGDGDSWADLGPGEKRLLDPGVKLGRNRVGDGEGKSDLG